MKHLLLCPAISTYFGKTAPHKTRRVKRKSVQDKEKRLGYPISSRHLFCNVFLNRVSSKYLCYWFFNNFVFSYAKTCYKSGLSQQQPFPQNVSSYLAQHYRIVHYRNASRLYNALGGQPVRTSLQSNYLQPFFFCIFVSFLF